MLGANPHTGNCGLRVYGPWLLQARFRPVHFAQILRSLGVSTPGLMGWITIVVELVGGPAVLILGGTGPLSLGYLTAKFKSKRAISIGDKV